LNVAEVASRRARLWDAGFRPVAVYTVEAGRRLHHDKPGKHPFGKAWQMRARRDPPEAVTAPPRLDTLNTGILCDGLRPIDLDIDNATIAHHCAQIAYTMFGEMPTRWRANSARRLLLLRAAHGEPGHRGIVSTFGQDRSTGPRAAVRRVRRP
jgi:hypothetical protein